MTCRFLTVLLLRVKFDSFNSKFVVCGFSTFMVNGGMTYGGWYGLVDEEYISHSIGLTPFRRASPNGQL